MPRNPLKTMETILAGPLTDIRVKTAEHFMTGKFAENELEDILRAIEKANTHTDAALLREQIGSVKTSLATGIVFDDPDLRYPETQLAWGAGLTFLAAH